MKQLELLEIDNPCIDICRSNRKGFCVGCYRSREERQQWYQFTEQEKGVVIANIKRRKKNQAAKLKRKSHTEQQEITENHSEVMIQLPIKHAKTSD